MTFESNEQEAATQMDALPFPYSQRPYCPYEPIEKSIRSIRVLVINNLILEDENLSDLARQEWGERADAYLERERSISSMAMDNIVSNVTRLVREPETKVVHLSKAPDEIARWQPHAIVISGTLYDFDYYKPELMERFGEFVRSTRTPVLGICGGHQLVGIGFGARCITLDDLEPHARREGREYEYQYRFVRIVEPRDPIFTGINDHESGVWQDYTTEGNVIRVWQNHGLQLDRVPEDFKLLATSYRCKNQMMVKRSEGQLIYTVQFHLEKSFQDLTSSLERVDPNSLRPDEKKKLLRHEASMRTLWAHPNESRDGRLLFENFLRLALEHHGLEP
jgi:GMP synthase-like glutamine amidotransferase